MSTEPTEVKTTLISKSRLEFLVDGIFAIAMTLLVLELKVPELAERTSSGELWHHLVGHYRVFFSFFLSLGILAVFWYRHQQIYHRLSRITFRALLLHLVFIVSVVFFPFCASLLGRYPGNPLSNVLYLGDFLVFQAGITLLWADAARQGAIAADIGPDQITLDRKRNLKGLLIISMLFLANAARIAIQ